MSNGKHRKKQIYKLENEGQIITDEAALKRHVTRYYKDLFGPPIKNAFTLHEHKTGWYHPGF